MNQAKTTKRIRCKIPIEFEKRIVELSYQNPELGAKRLLPLLKHEEIDVSSSSVYRILKRHGLQTRILRISKIEERCLAEAPSQDDETPPTQHVPVSLAVTKPEPVVETFEKNAPSPRSFQQVTTAEKPSGRSRSLFLIVNSLLLALIVYFGFHATQYFQPVRLKSDAGVLIHSFPISAAVQPRSTPRAFSDYRKIWHRNLFNSQKQKAPMQHKDKALEDLVVAKTDIGLKLMGTVVANNNPIRLAIIQNLKTAEQGIYHQEDKVGEAYVKKILRNKVIISIDNGDQLLTVESEDFGKPQGFSLSQMEDHSSFQNQRDPDIDDSFALATPESTLPRSRTKSIRLERDEVESALADIDGLMGQLRISPYKRGGQPSGFRISGITRDSVLRKLGLRSRDVIREVNGQVIAGPDQAVDFFNTLSQGGDLTIKLKRRRRDRWIHLDIE